MSMVVVTSTMSTRPSPLTSPIKPLPALMTFFATSELEELLPLVGLLVGGQRTCRHEELAFPLVDVVESL